ncbi:MAG TPA: hypothetical protein DEO82_05675 [Eubacterium sp.]|nr:hypothetical protein [Eubacterium sp.]
MRIQVVCSKPRKETNGSTSEIEYVSLRDIRSIDEYDVTVLDLAAPEIWCNDGDKIDTINQENHFESMSYMLSSSKAPILICLPQNIGFKHKNKYKNIIIDTDLKDMIKEYEGILNSLFHPLFKWGLRYENTVTTIENQEFTAAFYFSTTPDGWVVCKSKSNRAVLIKSDNVYVTTLSIENVDKLKLVLGVIGLKNERQEVPDWMIHYPMFDDEKQKSAIAEWERQIEGLQANIEKSKQILIQNDRMKSVLYKTGEPLVEIVFEILQELLGCDLSEFVDEKKEDFLFQVKDVIFIGEIKGVNHNVKNENISQLDVHYQSYMDDHELTNETKVKALLIMNYQKNKEPNQRDQVKETQINLAKRNGSLIIDTLTLLRVLEKYRDGLIARNEILAMLSEQTGILVLGENLE